jgi:hypothetical protein
VHRMAKEIIAKARSIRLPSLYLRIGEYEEERVAGGPFVYEKVFAEKQEGSFRPDLILEAGDRRLLIEIVYTNPVSKEKAETYRRDDIPSIWIDLSGDLDDLRTWFDLTESQQRKIVLELAHRRWIHNRDEVAGSAKLYDHLSREFNHVSARIGKMLNSPNFPNSMIGPDHQYHPYIKFIPGSEVFLVHWETWQSSILKQVLSHDGISGTRSRKWGLYRELEVGKLEGALYAGYLIHSVLGVPVGDHYQKWSKWKVAYLRVAHPNLRFPGEVIRDYLIWLSDNLTQEYPKLVPKSGAKEKAHSWRVIIRPPDPPTTAKLLPNP